MSDLSNREIAEFSFDLQVGLEGADVPEYDAARIIGTAAVLAVNLRGLQEVDYKVLRIVASRLFHIRSESLDDVLHVLAELGLVRLITEGRSIKKVVPLVPHFRDVYAVVGEYNEQKSLNEIEQVTFEILKRLYEAPENKDKVFAALGAEKEAFRDALDISSRAGVVTSKRARGRDILVSPLYFSGNLSGLIDVAARGDTPHMRRVFKLISENQGMPLSLIFRQQEIAGNRLIPEEIELLTAMLTDGILKPPSIRRPNDAEEQFVFTPAPGKVRLTAANREIYEKAMAISAAVRKGQLLPEQCSYKVSRSTPESFN